MRKDTFLHYWRITEKRLLFYPEAVTLGLFGNREVKNTITTIIWHLLAASRINLARHKRTKHIPRQLEWLTKVWVIILMKNEHSMFIYAKGKLQQS